LFFCFFVSVFVFVFLFLFFFLLSNRNLPKTLKKNRENEINLFKKQLLKILK
jgi:hypothetical protein